MRGQKEDRKVEAPSAGGWEGLDGKAAVCPCTGDLTRASTHSTREPQPGPVRRHCIRNVERVRHCVPTHRRGPPTLGGGGARSSADQA